MLYIGKNYKNFVKEARKKGISRNIPFNQLGSIKWNEKVICAVFERYNAPFKTTDFEKLKDGEIRPKQDHLFEDPRFAAFKKNQDIDNVEEGTLGTARLLCSFKASRIYIKDQEFMQKLLQDEKFKPKLVDFVDYTADEKGNSGANPGKEIDRDCGSYNITAGIVVDASVDEIVAAVKDISLKDGEKDAR